MGFSAKAARVAGRLDLDGREPDCKLLSGKVLVSKTTCREVGERAERTSAESAAALMWCRERPAPWGEPSPSAMDWRWRVVTPGSKTRSLWVSGIPFPSSITVTER